ncbi:subunit of axonemal inner dynein [Haematococcus lacustris]
MAATLTYTVFSLGEAQLHQLHAKEGKLFVMGEVAVELFQESPTAFLQELRKGKFNRLISSARDVLHTIAELQLPVESSASMTGVTLLPSATVEGLLVEKRKLELVQPFKLALLKLASQEAARLMAAGEYELALPVALDAVQQGQLLFKPAPALQLFPLYLLAAQANLGLRRAKQCEDFLALASWLAMKEPGLTTNIMKSQLSRLYGQLYAFQGRQDEAVAAFAEDVYYCAVEYGPEDPRTTLGFYNMGKVHQNRGDTTKSLACTNMVVKVWSAVLCKVVLGMSVTQDGLVAEQSAPAELPVGRLQLMEVVDMLLDIGRVRLSLHGSGHSSVADAHFVTALALVQLEERERASEQLEAAAAIYAQAPSPQQTRLVEMARIMLNVI